MKRILVKTESVVISNAMCHLWVYVICNRTYHSWFPPFCLFIRVLDYFRCDRKQAYQNLLFWCSLSYFQGPFILNVGIAMAQSLWWNWSQVIWVTDRVGVSYCWDPFESFRGILAAVFQRSSISATISKLAGPFKPGNGDCLAL